ncbi:MAG: hypothetical protein QJR03_13565 [Sphaerobacter sp.]|nr:hypothetical protein [Sphaerobacter sp.]
MQRHPRVTIVLVLLLASVSLTPPSARADAAPAISEPAFARLWELTERPVARAAVIRSWLWGPAPLDAAVTERYVDAPGGARRVQYFDKGRMELTDPAGDPTSPWYVTSGLLTRELISGRVQIGHATYLNGTGAAVPVAGDPTNDFPTYRDLAAIVDQPQPDRTGAAATTVLTPSGTSTRDDLGQDAAVRFVRYVTYTGPAGTPVGYNIPAAFWAFMTQPGMVERGGSLTHATPLFDWLFVLGYPIADPFWVRAQVAGVARWVLVQPFERRVLTYTPDNPPGWQVEMGNIGQHYWHWRYGATPPTTSTGELAGYGIAQGREWSYATTMGIDTTWRISGTSDSFTGGSTLITREERGWNGRFVSYWSVGPSGLVLHGQDQLDADGNLRDSVLYWPPVRYLPSLPLQTGVHWQTNATVLSIGSPARDTIVSGLVLGRDLVATPAGFFLAWKIELASTVDRTAPSGFGLSATLWFEPGIGVIRWQTRSYAAQLKSATVLPLDAS